MKEIISSGLAELGLADRVPEHAPEQLAEYGRLMLEKNQVMNLTAIREEDGVARLHMLDSAALLNWGDFEGKTLLDVGTGAGLPGLPLKILVPSLQVTLLDSLNKRLADRQLKVELTDAAMNAVIDQGFDPVYGARPLKRFIQSKIETLVAKHIIAADVKPGDTLTIDVNENGELYMRW